MKHSVELEKGWELSEIIERTREFLWTKTGTFVNTVNIEKVWGLGEI